MDNYINNFYNNNMNEDQYTQDFIQFNNFNINLNEDSDPNNNQTTQNNEYMYDADDDFENDFEIMTPLENLYNFMENGFIQNFDYLFSRSWFVNNYSLHEKIFKIIMHGKGNIINVFIGNFEEHIDDIINNL